MDFLDEEITKKGLLLFIFNVREFIRRSVNLMESVSMLNIDPAKMLRI